MATNFDSTSNPMSLKDQARLAIGDTGTGGAWLRTDETIQAAITPEYNEGVAKLCEGLAAEYAQYPDEVDTAGNTGMKWTKRVSTWLEIAKRYRGIVPEPGGRPRRGKLGALTNTGGCGLRL